jgi:Tol biopolymer transport system component
MRRLGHGLAIALCAAAAARGQQVDLVSRAGMPADSAGLASLLPSYPWSVSDDGRHSVYLSTAPNVVPGQVDLNAGGADAFLFDRIAGTTTLLSHVDESAVTTGLNAVSDAAISANGAYVAFASSELYLYERATGTRRALGYGFYPSLSADGRFLAYYGSGPLGASALVYDRVTETTSNIGLTYSQPRISADGAFVLRQDYVWPDYPWLLHDRTTGTDTLVDHAASDPATPGDGPSWGAEFSGDGAYVTFVSYATNLVAGQVDAPGTPDVFLFERATGDVRLVTHAPGSSVTATGSASAARIGRDGRFVVVESSAPDLVSGQADTNGGADVFLYDRATGQVSLVSHVAGQPATAGAGGGTSATISADGGHVAFVSSSTDLMAGQVDPTPGYYYPELQAFVYERATDSNRLASHAVGQPALGTAGVVGACAIAGGGGFVLYASPARNLANVISANLENDVFLYERPTGLNHLVSPTGRPSATANEPSSVDSAGVPRSLRTSADGRYVVFTSAATNLVPGQVDANGVPDVFLYDRGSGQTTLVSRAAGSATTAANGTYGSSFATISPDGSFVLFLSGGTNLVPGQLDATGEDYFLFERATGAVSLVNHPPGQPETTTGYATAPAVISDDGRFVALALAGDFGAGYAPSHVLDRQTGTLQALPFGFYGGDIDAEGRFIALYSSYSGADVHVFELATGTTTFIAGGATGPPAISADGRFVAFSSRAVDLVPGQVDAPDTDDVFLHDRTTGATILASHGPGSPTTAVGAYSGYATVGMSRDGRYVVFDSSATGLVTGQNDTNGTYDVFLFDRETGLVTLVSHAFGLSATAAAGQSYRTAISGDGSVVAFESYATDLVSAQSGPSTGNVFLYERASGTVVLASRSATGATGNGLSREMVLSRAGGHVYFASDASDLVAEDFNRKTDVFAFGACSAPPVIAIEPADQSVPLGGRATFQVLALNAGGYQWQKEGLDIPGATGLYYTTPPLTAADSGSTYGVVVRGACAAATPSRRAVVTIADENLPEARLLSPAGGEYWLLSPASGPARLEIVSWTMSDDVRVCHVAASLHHSSDGGATYLPAPAGGGLPVTFGSGGSCPYPGVNTTNLAYTVPSAFPSGTSGSLYKVRLVVTDQAGNATTAWSANPFYIVQANPDTVRTLVLSNVSRMQALQGLSSSQAAALTGKLLELAGHPRVQGVVVDLASVTALAPLYAALDSAVAADDGTSPARANDLLFAPNGLHDYLRSLLAVYSGVRHLVLVGDDRIVPLARMPDATVLLRESAYTAAGDLRGGATSVGQALAADTYLSDDPLAVRDEIRPADLAGSLFVPDLEVGRLVETAPEITTTIATFIGQNGIVDLSLLDPSTGHKALVTGYDFLTDGARRVRARWKAVFGATATPDASIAPVDGSLVGGNWGLGSASARASALRTRLSGQGGPAYGVVSLSGHAAHSLEGVPGNDFTDIQGLSTSEIYGPDACGSPSLGALSLSGTVVYAAGCHGGLPVPGSCLSDADHSLDLPQTFLARGVQCYVANTGYGWGLKYGVGYGERLSELMTEELSSAATVRVGEAVRRAKQRYFLEAARFDPYDQKTLMQWTVYGLPMYAVRTGIGAAAASDPSVLSAPSALEGSGSESSVVAPPAAEGRTVAPAPVDTGSRALVGSPGRVGVRRSVLSTAAQPPFLTQVNLTFDFTAAGLYQKRNSTGDHVASTGCPDPNGCYYTLNGLATGSADLPVQPYFVYDSRLSGTSQHGVLWKGGTYDEETGWTPVFSELVSTRGGADASNHGDAPRLVLIRPTAPRLLPGEDPRDCRSADLEVASVVSPAGEALEAQDQDPTYSIERRYRTVDLEAFYFNHAADPAQNCDRDGPSIGAGPFAGAFHQITGRTVSWSVPATDPSGIWRVLVVSNDNSTDALGRGRWVPLDLSFNVATGRWEGSRSDLSGHSTRLTYVLQAVDTRGNLTWLDWVSASLPASGTDLDLPRPVDVTVPPGTTVTGFSPASAAVGATVTVSGTNFVGVSLVTFGGVPASFAPVSSTELTATVPPGALTGPIEVTASFGKGQSPSSFVVVSPPTITGFMPTDGPVGTLVRIAGAHLTGATAVSFGGTAAVFAVLSDAEVEASVPAGAVTGTVGVTTPFGAALSATLFTVTGSSGGGQGFHTLTPCRAVDTRSETPALAAGETRVFTLAGRCAVPATARALSLNVTATAATANGNLRLYPAGVALPTTSVINYTAGLSRANNATIALSSTGEIAVTCSQASGSVHLVLDVNGYFE